ncbi:YdaU family protein [Flavobacterium sp.]|jgi:uncharacterized protein YdaU (DUF1376 family)|uniref:YdaU family protein n=1 Tax=Flavobacterium sp. TaxID=239 RepID=UPI0037C11E97
MHYYEFNIGDYMRDTAHLDEMEDLAYRRMLDLYYLKESPLPVSIQEIAKLIRMRTHCDCIANVLREFFTLTESGYVNSKADTTLNKIYDKSEKAKKSAEKRWENQKVKNANALPTHSERNANGMLPNNLTTQQPNNLNINVDSVESPEVAEKEKPTKFAEEIKQVFDHWAKVMNKTGRSKLTKERQACIIGRLKESYTVAHIMQAIDGCKRSEFHMGKNDKGTVYDDLTLICRSGSQLEKFAMNIGAGEKTYAGPQSAAAAAIEFEQRRQAMSDRIAQELAELGPDGY